MPLPQCASVSGRELHCLLRGSEFVLIRCPTVLESLPCSRRHCFAYKRRPMKFTTKFVAAILAAVGTGAVLAQDIKVGVTVSATGPAASLGIPERNTFPLLPQTIGGRKVQYIV